MDKHTFGEIEVSRLKLRDPRSEAVRAVLEIVPGETPVVRFSMFAVNGDARIVIEIDDEGVPKLSVGPPDRGDAVILTPNAVDVWRGGDQVASVPSAAVESREPRGTYGELPGG